MLALVLIQWVEVQCELEFHIQFHDDLYLLSRNVRGTAENEERRLTESSLFPTFTQASLFIFGRLS